MLDMRWTGKPRSAGKTLGEVQTVHPGDNHALSADELQGLINVDLMSCNCEKLCIGVKFIFKFRWNGTH